ncbi:hypothetical protein BJ912DRAFT_1062099 [Pholiota molesta]|nr:hypothetical protein BJ912DRAFT_1062099 [Pholiota molesta]
MLLSSFTATQAQAQDPLTSTFLSLPMPSLPSTLPSSPPPSQIYSPEPHHPSTTDHPQQPATPRPNPRRRLHAARILQMGGAPRRRPAHQIRQTHPLLPEEHQAQPHHAQAHLGMRRDHVLRRAPGRAGQRHGLGVCFPRHEEAQEDGEHEYDDSELPPMCAPGQFCPDDGSGCRGQVGIGAVCELDRDDQCQPPPLEPGVKDADNKAVCLNKVCMAATLPLGAPCIIENTTYVGDVNRGTAGGGQFTTVVIKHNCLAPGLFCDPTPPDADITGSTCQPSKKLGERCRFDVECESTNCSTPGNRCAVPAETPTRVEPWQWVVTVLFIVASLTSAILVLLLIQRRRRFKHYQHLQSYFTSR